MPTSEPAGIAFLLTICGVLLLVSVLSSRASQRIGVPIALFFLVVGMLAGSEGIGGINFEDYHFAFRMGVVALALILFDGGLNTPLAAIRRTIGPAGVLATVHAEGMSFAQAVQHGAMVEPAQGEPDMPAPVLACEIERIDRYPSLVPDGDRTVVVRVDVKVLHVLLTLRARVAEDVRPIHPRKAAEPIRLLRQGGRGLNRPAVGKVLIQDALLHLKAQVRALEVMGDKEARTLVRQKHQE